VAAEITGLLNEAIGEARGLARGLAPVGLDEAGLGGALEILVVNVQYLFRTSCTLDCDRRFPRLPRETGAHLFRIAQEAVRNALSRGRADRVGISLSSQGGKGLLSVRDDGVGLAEPAGACDGIGMHTMAYRARLIGGALDVRRRARGGTAVTCTFPLPETADSRETLEHERRD
jgi:signal transduction histidine kinase